MPDLFEFMQMTSTERVSYIQRNGLTREQRQELLRANEVIATLIQQDRFWEHQREHVKVRMTFVHHWTSGD